MSGADALAAFHAALVEDDADLLYDRAPCGYLSTMPDGLIVKVNQTFLTLTGYTRGELVGRRSFASLLTPGGRIYHETHYAPMLRMHGEARGIALDLVQAAGDRLPVLVNAVLDRDDAGTPRTVRAAVFDATDRRQYEHELLLAKRRAEESEEQARRLARTLQQTLIPPAPPQVPGLDVAAAYRPAGAGDEVGGDFYDIFPLSRQEWVVLLGDVSGKGVEAAVVTALARWVVRESAVRAEGPAAVLQMLGEAIAAHETDRFCTAMLIRLVRDAEGWSATISSGGHPLPLLVRVGRAPQELGQTGSLLGLFPATDLVDVTVRLHPGDALLLYTDGVTEGRRGREFYGEQRLVDAMSLPAGSAGRLVEHVLDDVLAFQAQHARDDIAVVVLRVPDEDDGARPAADPAEGPDGS